MRAAELLLEGRSLLLAKIPIACWQSAPADCWLPLKCVVLPASLEAEKLTNCLVLDL
jgi:hypothetical protein